MSASKLRRATLLLGCILVGVPAADAQTWAKLPASGNGWTRVTCEAGAGWRKCVPPVLKTFECRYKAVFGASWGVQQYGPGSSIYSTWTLGWYVGESMILFGPATFTTPATNTFMPEGHEVTYAGKTYRLGKIVAKNANGPAYYPNATFYEICYEKP